MDAVQRMRQRAQQAGRLQPTPQLNVVNGNDAGQPYIGIEPANPDVIYVPVYNPAWIWGPPLWYPYPSWYWPPLSFLAPGWYFGFGWHGWGGWGWHPGWGRRTIIVNNAFIHQYNFNAGHIINAHGTSEWAHDPEHRGGVPYANRDLQNRYQGNVRQNLAPRSIPEAARNAPGQTQERFGNRTIPGNTPAVQQNRGAFSGMQNGSAATPHAEHGFSSLGPTRSAPAPRAAPAPRSAPAPSGGRRR